MTTRHAWLATLLMGLASSACEPQATAPASAATGPGRASASEPLASGDQKADALPRVAVYKHASCGCCDAWVEHMRVNGFEVQVHDGRVVQVETREKVRFADDRRPEDRRRQESEDGRADRAAGGAAPSEEEIIR